MEHTLGQAIRQARKRKGLTTEQVDSAVEALTGKRPASGAISRIERGVIKQPNIETVRAVAEVLAMNEEWLLRTLAGISDAPTDVIIPDLYKALATMSEDDQEYILRLLPDMLRIRDKVVAR